MLRVFIIRIACQKAEQASKLLRPILSWINDHTSDLSSLSDTEAYKVITAKFFLAKLPFFSLWLFRLLYQIISFSLGRFIDALIFSLAYWSIHMPRFYDLSMDFFLLSPS